MILKKPANPELTTTSSTLENINPHYYKARSWLVFWAACSFVTIVGFTRLSYGLLLPAIQTELVGSYSLLGLVGTANFTGYLLGSLAVPLGLTRLVNPIRLNGLTLLVMNVALLLSATSADLGQLGGWRFVIGFFSALANVLTVSLTLERIHPAERGMATGLLWVGSSTGIIISGLIAPLVIGGDLGATGWRVVWLGMGLAGLIAAFGTYHSLKANSKPAPVAPIVASRAAAIPSEKLNWLETLAELFQPGGLLLLTLAHIGFGFGYIVYSTFFAALFTQQGMAPVATGLVWAGMGFMAAAGAIAWGRAIDRWPNGFTLALSLATGAVGTLGVATGQIGLQLAGTILFGLFLFGPGLIITVLFRQAIPGQRYALSYSFLTTTFAGGQLAGPVVGGLVVDHFGLVAGIGVSTGLLAIAACLAFSYACLQKRNQPSI